MHWKLCSGRILPKQTRELGVPHGAMTHATKKSDTYSVEPHSTSPVLLIILIG